MNFKPLNLATTIAACAIVVSLAKAVDSPAKHYAYTLTPGETLRYSIKADIAGSLPILDSPTPIDLTASIKMVYLATPRTRLADGTSDVDFKIEPGSVEVELAKIPFPVPEDQANSILNQVITLSKLGQVIKTQNTKPLPFGVSIPGVDPKRLFALLYPVVFAQRAVKPGESWTFKSELLGSEGVKQVFHAKILPLGSAPMLPKGKKPAIAVPGIDRIGEDFEMAVNQNLTSDKKEATTTAETYKTRIGKINGIGEFQFDGAKGHIKGGTVNISVNIKETLTGKPLTEDEPKEAITKLNAKITVALEPAPHVSKKEK
ncbi:MAG: hypothetical protein ABJA67_03990 [Chthonomonadales bacterium]